MLGWLPSSARLIFRLPPEVVFRDLIHIGQSIRWLGSIVEQAAFVESASIPCPDPIYACLTMFV